MRMVAVRDLFRGPIVFDICQVVSFDRQIFGGQFGVRLNKREGGFVTVSWEDADEIEPVWLSTDSLYVGLD